VSSKPRADLQSAARAALDAAATTGETQWVALQAETTRCDALAAFAGTHVDDRFYWERPAAGRAIAALGCAGGIEAEGARRFAEASERAASVFERLHVSGRAIAADAGPFLVGGFAFASCAPREPHWKGFSAGRMILPEITLAATAERSWLTIVQSVERVESARLEIRAREICDSLRARFDQVRGQLNPLGGFEASSVEDAGPPRYLASADRAHAEYRAQVEAALREIAEGGFEKVVLARSISVSETSGYDSCALLDALRRAHPSCAIFAVARPGAVFLGATPECLVRLVGSRVETASVAGSAPRGRSPEEDLDLGRRLRESKKEQTEHAFVVRALRDALAPYCSSLEVQESPRLMRLQDIQHLETPIAGQLREPRSILELVGAIHPTPAIAGAPRDAALAWLHANESLDRGWYSGPIGFADPDGGGEFFAALRSAVLRGNEAQLFAGAGIVSGSDPESELRETRLKLRAMLAPLMEI